MSDSSPLPDEVPEDGTITLSIAVGYCYECREVLGPDHAGDVSFELYVGEHELHDTMVIDSWEEEEEIRDLRLALEGADL